MEFSQHSIITVQRKISTSIVDLKATRKTNLVNIIGKEEKVSYSFSHNNYYPFKEEKFFNGITFSSANTFNLD